jgi:adenylate cyclase
MRLDACSQTRKPMTLRDLVRSQPKHGIELPGWLERVVSVGIVTTDPQIARRQRFTNVAAFAAAANATSHFLILAAYNFGGLIIVNIYNALFTLAALAVPRLHRFGEHRAAIALVLLIVVGNLFVVWALGITSDLHIYFTLAGGMLFFFGVQNWRVFLGFFLLVAAVLLFTLNYAPVDGFVLPEDGHLRDLLSSHAMINTITINAAIIFYALTALRQAEHDLEQQYARSEALVTTVMPAAIASRLKSGQEARIADRIERLSVLFADLVGFTGASRGLSPDTVVDYLDHLVCTFDALCERHGVEKIKTIGDCYMAVAGLDGREKEGAVAIGQFALSLIAAISHQPPLGDHQLGLRVGIHCGPATAGVIGDTRISYDVWGDAVNIASRMESHGVAGFIHVSAEFRTLAHDSFEFEERGTTDVKGIGSARTFFLIGERV